MKTTTAAALAALALFTAPAPAAAQYFPSLSREAQQLWRPRMILPNVFAARFCELRSIGVSKDDAMTAAFRDSVIDGQAPQVKLSNGSTIGSDVVLSFNAVQRRCPGQGI